MMLGATSRLARPKFGAIDRRIRGRNGRGIVARRGR